MCSCSIFKRLWIDLDRCRDGFNCETLQTRLTPSMHCSAWCPMPSSQVTSDHDHGSVIRWNDGKMALRVSSGKHDDDDDAAFTTVCECSSRGQCYTFCILTTGPVFLSIFIPSLTFFSSQLFHVTFLLLFFSASLFLLLSFTHSLSLISYRSC